MDDDGPRLLIATNNPGKAAEFRTLLAGSGWELVTPSDLGLAPIEVVESSRSYLDNAVAKAVRHAAASGLPALADDSGLEVDALGGRPGVLSARYGGPQTAGAAARNARLLAELEGVPKARRGARFRAVLALAMPRGETYVREATVEGRIATAASGAEGFGYDPIFELPDGRTMAEIGDEKHTISHRGRAAREILKVLEDLA
jgi:XTP/dITP diphosphohydrolase